MWTSPPLQGDNDVDAGDYHEDNSWFYGVHEIHEIFTFQLNSFWQLNISA